MKQYRFDNFKPIVTGLAALLVLTGTGGAAFPCSMMDQEKPALRLANLGFQDAVNTAPLIVRGRSVSGRSLAFRDGPQTFRFEVSEFIKGKAQNKISFSAWSSLYAIQLPRGKETVVFLRKAGPQEKAAPWVVMTRSLTDPLVFTVENDRLTPHFTATADWENLTLTRLRKRALE